MKRWISLLWFMGCVAAFSAAPGSQREAIQPPRVRAGNRFAVFDVFIDPQGQPLAAWQLQISAARGTVRLVGVEGGEPGPFEQPAHYDPKALRGDRIRLAAFSTAPAANLPRTQTRVATLHIQVIGPTEPQLTNRVEAAATASGQSISIAAIIQPRIRP